MAVDIPTNTHRSFVRIQVSDAVAINEAVVWTDLETGIRYDAPRVDSDQPYDSKNDPVYQLRFLRKASLPNYGELRFVCDYGTKSSNIIRPEDFGRQLVRVLMAPPGNNATYVGQWEDLPWECVWVGRMEYHQDDIRTQVRTYYAYELFYSDLSKLPIGQISAEYRSGGAVVVSPNPGYNVGDGLDTRDKDGSESDASGIIAHSGPGVPSDQKALWTDADIIKNILATNTYYNGTTFTLDASSGLGEATHRYPVTEQTTGWDLLLQVCDRRRSLGLATPQIEMEPYDSAGATSATLVFRPPFADDITYTQITDSVVKTITGAASAGNMIYVDLDGDHRVSSLSIDEKLINQYDRLVTQGEHIRSLVTLSPRDGSLVKGWTTQEATDYDALSGDGANAAAYGHVYRRFRLPYGWDFQVAGGDGGTATRCDYYCSDTGAIRVDRELDYPESMTLLERDTPLRDGWDYTNNETPGPADGAESSQQPLPPTFYLYDGSNYTSREENPELNINIFGREVNVMERGQGRFFASEDINELVITASLRLPSRVQFASNSPGATTVASTKVITVSGAELHMAHPDAIWSLDPDSAGGVLQNAGIDTGTIGGIIRDDRNAVQRAHELARRWYIDEHRPSSWTSQGNPFVSYRLAGGSTEEWPQVGQVVFTLTYSTRQGVSVNGTPSASPYTVIIDSPITSVEYTDNGGVEQCTFRTDWK